MAGQYGWWIDWKHGEGKEGVDWEWGTNHNGSPTKVALHDLGKPKDVVEDPANKPVVLPQGDIDTTFDRTTHKDFGPTKRQGNPLEEGYDPNKTTLDLSDKNAFMAAEYAAPGRPGEYEPGVDDPNRDNYQPGWPDAGTKEGQDAMYDLETRFIDELYGTTDRVISDTTFTTDADGNEIAAEGALGAGIVTQEWGLDLKRDLSDLGEDPTSDKDAYYEAVTRGEIDWEFYSKDNAYKAAFEAFKGDGWTEGYGFDDQEGITSVEEIRALNPTAYKDVMADGQGKDAWKTDWEGKYEPKFDIDTAPEYTPAYQDVSSTGYVDEGDASRVIKKKTYTKAMPLPTADERRQANAISAEFYTKKVTAHVANTKGLKIGGTS